MARPIVFFILLLFPALGSPAFAQNGTRAIVISGGIDRQSNHVRYENNVRLLSDILKERGYSREQTKVLFNEGVKSEVSDPDSANAHAEAQWGIPSEFRHTFRPNNVSDLIDGPATSAEIASLFSDTEKAAKEGAVKRVVLYSSDHGTANTNDFSQSYISLVGDDRLTYDTQDKFVRALNNAGTKAVLIGEQCYSGHNMGIALKNPNACAFSSAAPFEMSYSLTREVDDLYNAVPRLGYSTYAFFFACALHRPDATGNQADQHCDRFNADFNRDGKVSFAEAHQFALARMDPSSVPQMSSQVYAMSIAASLTAAGAPEAKAVAECSRPDNSLAIFTKDMGALVDPALSKAIQERLSTERDFLGYLLKGKDLLGKIKAKPEDPLELKIGKVEAALAKAERAREKIMADIKKALAARNAARVKREGMRAKVLDSLLKEKPENLPRSLEKIKEAEAILSRKELSPRERQLAQNTFNRAKQEIDFRVDAELEKPAHAAAYGAVKKEIQKLDDERKRLENVERTNLEESGSFRRFHQAYGAYRAQVAVLTAGSPEQKSKLLQLYECENETL